MEKEDLKERARSFVQLPDRYELMLEDYGEDGGFFVWGDESEDESITVQLDLSGRLTRLFIDQPYPNFDQMIHIEQRLKQAERFLLNHYPEDFQQLTFTRTKEMPEAIRFYFEQLVMDLPLDESGCLIDIDACGNVVKFVYEGLKPVPEIPKTIILKERLAEDVQNGLDFQLAVTQLYSFLHNVAEDGPRLVYEPTQSFMTYKADVLRPTLTIEQEEDEPETYIPLSVSDKRDEPESLTVEEIVGIPSHMEIIREVDMGEETGIVWRDPDWKMEEQDLSIDSFFRERTADTVKAFLSKETGKVKSFMWFNERKGDLQLSREECFKKALDFLQSVFPKYAQYLQLIDQEEEEQDSKERFAFHMHNGHGIPVQSGLVLIVVNRTTGQIDHYSGPGYEPEDLAQIPVEPMISKEEAGERFMERLDFELVWKTDYDSEREDYHLAYRACDRITRLPIRYIDAMTGEMVTDRE